MWEREVFFIFYFLFFLIRDMLGLQVTEALKKKKQILVV